MTTPHPTPERRRVALAASHPLRVGAAPVLAQVLGAIGPYFERAGITLVATAGTARDVRTNGWVPASVPIESLPAGPEGGFISMTARVVDPTPAAVDAVLYLIDPQDLRTLHPETLALKRQCVVHGKPFLSTPTSAIEWFMLAWAELEAEGEGAAPSAALRALIAQQADFLDLSRQSLALVAHDARKEAMTEFARRHQPILARFGHRCGTGTTGARVLAALGMSADSPWFERLLSGPLGGDAQLAERVIQGRLGRVIFFEDPHVARQHEADIQLLERATRLRGAHCVCINDPVSAAIWARRMAIVQATRDTGV